MNEGDRPKPEPQRAPEPLDRPSVRLMTGDPEAQDRLRNHRPEQQPQPFEKREEEPTKLKHTMTPQRAPTLGMNGMVSYTNPDAWKSPQQAPQQQPEKKPEPVPDILAEARKRIAERGGEGRPAERALAGGLELSPEGIAGLERRCR